MNQTFYQFIRTYCDPYKQDKATLFANCVAQDVAFPRKDVSYAEIADYLELTDSYLAYLATFDMLWEIYQERTRN